MLVDHAESTDSTSPDRSTSRTRRREIKPGIAKVAAMMATRSAPIGLLNAMRSASAMAAADSTKVVRAIPRLGGVETFMSPGLEKRRRAYHTRFPLPLLPSGPGGVHVALSVGPRGGLTFRSG